MNKILNSKYFPIYFLLFGVILQIVTFAITHDSILSLVSGLCGCISVVLCSCKKITQYVFGFAQLITYVILSWGERFYGELVENGFYFITMIIGLVIWFKNYNTSNFEVETRELSKKWLIGLLIGTIVISYVLGIFLGTTNDSQPMLDSFTTVPAFVAQILLILRYREQWLFWLIIDVGCIFLWINADNYCMAVQYVFWTINCIFGWINWKKNLVV